MMNKEKIYTLAKIYTAYIAIASVAFIARVYLDVLSTSTLFDILTETGILNVSSMLIIGVHAALYATGGSDLVLMLFVALHIFIVAGSLASLVMILWKKKYGYLRISLIILTVDVVCHVLVGGIMFPAVIGLIIKSVGIYILSKAYKLHKNEQKENKNELT